MTIRDSGGPEPQPPCAINAFCVRDIDSGEYISDGTVSILGGTFDIQSFESNGIESDGDESAIGISGGTAEFTGGEAAIKLEKESKTNPYTGILPNVSFKGNTNYDTFTSMQAVNYKNQKKKN